MISNKLLNPHIIEALTSLSEEGLVTLNPVLEKLMSELMKVEREQVIGASHYERTDERKGYCNGFKNKKLAVAEMYFSGVSTRRVKQITEELCGMEISSSQVSRLAALLDDELEKFRKRPLNDMSIIYLDAHYEKVDMRDK